MKRADVYNSFFSAKALFVSGLIIMPALVFNPGTELRVIQFLFFLFLVWLTGKKINFIFTLLVAFFIVVFNLLIPYGRVLYSFGIFKITSGALEAGIHRAFTLQALVMLSKAAVRQDLKLPGSFGGLLGESLRIFSVLMTGKYRIFSGAKSAGECKTRQEKKGVIANIDNILLELSSDSPSESEEISRDIDRVTRTKPAGFIILTVIIILSWLPWLLL